MNDKPRTGTPVLACAPGDLIAELYRTHAVELVRIGLLLLGDQHGAEDVVQDAFLGLHRGLARLRDPDKALAYLRASVVNGCRSVHRRRSRMSHSDLAAEPAPVWSAEAAAIAGEDRRAVLAAVAGLPERAREVLAFRYFLGLPDGEIATALGIGRSTISSTASRALDALARKLEEQKVNDLEGRLKEAYACAAGIISKDNIRQLDEQSVVITWPPVRPQQPARRWVIPLTTAAALAVIVATAIPAFLTGGGSSIALNPLGERFVSALVPNSRDLIIIINLATAKQATVPLPGRQETFRTAATGDGVTYVAAVTKPRVCGTWLYQFTLNSAGKPGRLTPFDGGYLHQNVNQVGLSADNRTFAYLAHRCSSGPAVAPANFTVVNLKTGQRRQWSVPGQAKIGPFTLTGDGGRLAFSGGPINGVRSAIYLLDTSSAPGPVGQRSRVLVNASKFGRGYTVVGSMVALNGRVVYFMSVGPGTFNPAEEIRSINIRSGRIRSVHSSVGMFSIAADPSVRHLIYGFQPGFPEAAAVLLNLKNGRVTNLKSDFFVPLPGQYIW
jgi:RNA polymerase sigma factor (sigma-70 family)